MVTVPPSYNTPYQSIISMIPAQINQIKGLLNTASVRFCRIWRLWCPTRTKFLSWIYCFSEILLWWSTLIEVHSGFEKKKLDSCHSCALKEGWSLILKIYPWSICNYIFIITHKPPRNIILQKKSILFAGLLNFLNKPRF